MASEPQPEQHKPEQTEHRTPEGFRRLIAFTDAVVAIALTLLVLPLADIAGEVKDEAGFGALWSDHADEFISFAVSFGVIWLLWRQHHRSMENFRAYDDALMNLHFLWLFTIVVLPFATALISGTDFRWGNVFYIGVLMVSVGSLIGMTRWGVSHPELITDDEQTRSWARAPGGYGTIAMLVVAMIISVIYPQAGSWPLCVLFLSGPTESLLARLRPTA